MKIFLTGGTGFLGLPLTKKLLQRGWNVTVFARNIQNDAAKSLASDGAELVSGNITDRESMRDSMQGADIVIHNAGWYEFGIARSERDLMARINIEGTRNTLGLAYELGIQKIIYVSTILVYGQTGDTIADETFQRRVPPRSHYEYTKSEAHKIATSLQQAGAPIVILSPAGVIGPGDHSGVGYLIRMYVRHILPPMLFARNGTRAHVQVDDAAEAIVRSIEYGRIGEEYILSNGVMRHSDMIDLWKTTPGGSKVTLFWMPKPIAMAFCSICEPIQHMFKLPNVFTREFADAGFGNWKFTAEKAERELGMKFRSLEQAFLDTIEAEREIIQQRKSS